MASSCPVEKQTAMASSCPVEKQTAMASSPPPHSPLFTPIQENEREEDQDQELHHIRRTPIDHTDANLPSKYHPTPLHPSNNGKPSCQKRLESDETNAGDRTVSCNKCRPSAREKILVVPLDVNVVNEQSSSSIASPNGIFKLILSSLTRKSLKSLDSSTGREDQWKVVVAELSHKLIQTTRKRDEAVLEASRLKYSRAELEKKLNKLEIYCHDLKSGLQECSSNSHNPATNFTCSVVIEPP